MIKFGYRVVEEQYQPSRMLDFAVLAEKHGFEFICISDHFHPWFHTGACGGHSWIWIGTAGSKTSKVRLGTGVTTSIYRYHPAIIAQAFATLDELYPGRIFLGIGTGEAMNEAPIAPPKLEWPNYKERIGRTVEAVKIIKALWEKDFVDFRGKYYQLRQANLYTKPKTKIPIYFAAFGPKSLRVAGQLGDGLIGDAMMIFSEEDVRKIFSAYDEGVKESGRMPQDMPRMVEMKISYDEDYDKALKSISMWRPVKGELDITDPRELERLRESVDYNTMARYVYTNMDQLIREIERLIKMGFNEIQVGSSSPDEEKFVKAFGKKALPYLKEKYSI